MFFRKSLRSLERVIHRHPEWAAPLARVLRIVRGVPAGGLIDPLVVSQVAQLSKLEALGYLNLLKEAGLGDFVVRVLDREGLEVHRYGTAAAIPARVRDEFGEEMQVMPENVDVSFEPRGVRNNPRVDSLLEATSA